MSLNVRRLLRFCQPGFIRASCSQRFHFAALQVSSGQKIRADHLQAVASRSIIPQHHSCCFKRLLDVRYCSVTSRDTTSAYFAFKSNRLWSWADCERSPTASRTTVGRKPVCDASTAEARTQPLVVHPVTIRASTPRTSRRETRSVPKKQDAYFLISNESVGRKSSRESIRTPSVRAQSGRPFLFYSKNASVLQVFVFVGHR